MRPEKLALMIADAIRSVVAPLVKQVNDLKGTVAALEARDARQNAAITDLQKSLIDTRGAVLALENPRPLHIDMHGNDPRH